MSVDFTRRSFSDRAASIANSPESASDAARTDMDLLITPGDTRLRPVPRKHFSTEIENASQVNGLMHAVAGSNRAVTGIRLMSATPGLDTFTEIFEIMAPRTITLDGAERFLAAWTLQSKNRNRNATRSEWFVWEERTHNVRFPTIGHRNVTLEDAVSMGMIPENTAPESIAPEDVAETAPGTVIVRVPYIVGMKMVKRSWSEWVPLASSRCRTLKAGETRLFKVIHRAC